MQGLVAQWLEQGTHKPKVAGSNPAWASLWKKNFFSSIFIKFNVLFTLVIYNKERWLSGRKRRIANPMYESIVPRVRISSSPN